MEVSNTDIKWNRNLERYLKEVGEHALCLSMLHKDCESKYSHKALMIDLPVICSIADVGYVRYFTTFISDIVID